MTPKARLLRWVSLAAVAPEADPVRSLSLTAVAASTAVLSYASLCQLGLAIGLDPAVAWLFPLGFDAAVLAATRAWLHPKLGRATRRYAAGVAVLIIVCSVAGNSLQHWRVGVSAGDPAWWTATVIGFSALPPLVLGLVIHLAAMIATDVRTRKATEHAKAVSRAAAAQSPSVRQRAASPRVTPATLPAGVTPIASTGGARARRIEEVWRDAQASGEKLTYAEIDRRAKTVGYAKRVVPQLVREGNRGEVTSGQRQEGQAATQS